MNGSQDQQGSSDPQNWTPPAAPQSPPTGATAPPIRSGASSTRGEQPPISAYDPRYKSPLVASFLSLFPGVGQIYVGYYRVGFTNALVVASCITLLASRMDDTFRPLLAIFMAFFWLYNIIDAGRRAALYNHALREGASFDVPNTPSMSDAGSLAGGIAMIAIGGLFLMYTAWDFSMEWVEDWWPLGPMAFGAYLVFKSVTNRKEA